MPLGVLPPELLPLAKIARVGVCTDKSFGQEAGKKKARGQKKMRQEAAVARFHPTHLEEMLLLSATLLAILSMPWHGLGHSDKVSLPTPVCRSGIGQAPAHELS